jgi:molybdopterin-guanine dinucleotide biosynthesis protein A
MGGGDKSLRILAGRPILDHVVERIRPQVDVLALNANGNPARFRGWRLPVIPDSLAGWPGPLAGILAGMEWTQLNFPDATDIVSISTDSPFVPCNLVERVAEVRAAAGAEIAIAASGGRRHFVIALWPVRLASELLHVLTQEKLRKVESFASRYTIEFAAFPILPVDPFYNINNLEDLAEAERLMREEAGQQGCSPDCEPASATRIL